MLMQSGAVLYQSTIAHGNDTPSSERLRRDHLVTSDNDKWDKKNLGRHKGRPQYFSMSMRGSSLLWSWTVRQQQPSIDIQQAMAAPKLCPFCRHNFWHHQQRGNRCAFGWTCPDFQLAPTVILKAQTTKYHSQPLNLNTLAIAKAEGMASTYMPKQNSFQFQIQLSILQL